MRIIGLFLLLSVFFIPSASAVPLCANGYSVFYWGILMAIFIVSFIVIFGVIRENVLIGIAVSGIIILLLSAILPEILSGLTIVQTAYCG